MLEFHTDIALYARRSPGMATLPNIVNPDGRAAIPGRRGKLPDQSHQMIQQLRIFDRISG
jgi:hypothetical protein